MPEIFYFPVLYKLSATRSLQTWRIGGGGNTILTQFGQLGGKMQSVRDEVKAGKSIGKKLLVKYQGMTERGVPRFPVGIRIRESLDL